MPRKGREKNKREVTGSYDHLTKNQKDQALRQSENAQLEQKEAMDKVEEVLSIKEIKEEVVKADLEEGNPDAKVNARAIKHERAMTNNKPLSAVMQPRHVAAVRRKVYNSVIKNIVRADEVLQGKRKWTNQQVSLFTKMMNKVIPDLHHSVADVQHTFSGSVSDLPLEKLMEIAMEDAQVIDGELIEDDIADYADLAPDIHEIESEPTPIPDVIKKRREPIPPSSPHSVSKGKSKTVNRKTTDQPD